MYSRCVYIRTYVLWVSVHSGVTNRHTEVQPAIVGLGLHDWYCVCVCARYCIYVHTRLGRMWIVCVNISF